MTPRIKPLAAAVVGQIAAGEVVERPASVIKELVENSLDAGANEIEIDVVEGGRELLRVTDNGAGIDRDDLTLAVTSHATSKIHSADDLFQIHTMGFRGEALASIAGVSDFRIQSRPADQTVGAELEVRQGIVGPVVDCGCPVGTQIEVRHLFGSVPVRRKFLKTKQTELGHISEAVIRLALAHPEVTLTLKHDDRVLYRRPAGEDFAQTVELFFGQEIARALIPIESESDGIKLVGHVADPSVHRPTNRYQYLFVNGRFIRDRSLGHAVQESYRGLLLTGRHPVSFLFIDMPSEQVDVNVHPTKVEVRFEEPRRLYSQILGTIRERFLQADLSARWESSPASQPARPVADRTADDSSPARRQINEEFALSSRNYGPVQPSLWSTESRGNSYGPTGPSFGPAPVADESEDPRAPAEVHADESAPPAPIESKPTPTGPRERVRAIQLHDSYLVVETDEGMMLIDQHALHERIIYERLRARVDANGVETQELLVPEPVDMPPMQVALLLDQADVLARMGFRIEEFGDRCILIRSFPRMLNKIGPATLLRNIAGHLEETGKSPSRDQLLQELLHMCACKAAVKAGDPLTPGEIESLVEQRALVDDSHHCPHGRPTLLRFTLADLERQFQRK